MVGLGEKGSIGSLGTLIGLVLVALLVATYMREQVAPGGKAKSGPVNALASSRGVACQTQRTQLERDLVMWSASHSEGSASLEALRSGGVRVPSCPEGGSYSVSGAHVLCSKH